MVGYAVATLELVAKGPVEACQQASQLFRRGPLMLVHSNTILLITTRFANGCYDYKMNGGICQLSRPHNHTCRRTTQAWRGAMPDAPPTGSPAAWLARMGDTIFGTAAYTERG